MSEIYSSNHLDRTLSRKPRLVELVMVVVAVLVTCLLFALPRHWHVVLHLYFLPVSLSGFYLGRYRSGVMALLSVVAVAIASGISSEWRYMVQVSDVLAFAVWGAVLGLTSILTGTVCDERRRQLDQIRESHRIDTLKDALTDIANRRAFDYEITRRMAELDRQQTPFALILFDIDHFKKFNDAFGHQAGDAVIRGVAQMLEEIMRELDLVARYGGEEFAIVLPKSDIHEAKDAAERARRKIEASRFAFQDLPLRVTVSVGVVQAIKGENGHSLVERADAALYASKLSGRNCSTFHNGELCEAFGLSHSCSAVGESRNLVVDSTGVHTYWDRETNLPSRRVFIDDLRRRVAEAQRYEEQLSIVLVEIVGFQEMQNETPDMAQKVLAVIGEIVCDIVRDVDLVTRYSASQLAVSMPSTSLEGAKVPADRLQTSVAQCQTIKHNGTPLCFAVSVGVVEWQTNEDAVSLLERAQAAIGTQNTTPSRSPDFTTLDAQVQPHPSTYPQT